MTVPVSPARFVGEFAPRAYRRPPDGDEVDRIVALYTAAKADYGFEAGLATAIEYILQSPHFLYRVELGSPSAAGDVLALTDHELATRLSYFLWASMPDDELFAAAESGELMTADGIETQVRRMLTTPRARVAVALSQSAHRITNSSPP